jgi:hypothetical protein
VKIPITINNNPDIIDIVLGFIFFINTLPKNIDNMLINDIAKITPKKTNQGLYCVAKAADAI